MSILFGGVCSMLPYGTGITISLYLPVAWWVRHSARSSPCELITNVGGWRFDSSPGRWIFSSNMLYLLADRLSVVFSRHSGLLPLPQVASNKKK